MSEPDELHPINETEFVAILQGASCLRTDDDGSTMIRLTTDGSQQKHTMRLQVMLKQLLRVNIKLEPH